MIESPGSSDYDVLGNQASIMSGRFSFVDFRFVPLVDSDEEYDDENNGGFKRTLHQRQTQMIALSATIGSGALTVLPLFVEDTDGCAGLFLGSSSALTTAGPLGALLACVSVVPLSA